MPLDDNNIAYFPRIERSKRARFRGAAGAKWRGVSTRPGLWTTGLFAIGAVVATAVLVGSALPPLDLRGITATLEEPWISDMA